ncbi:MAG: hypothetical protein NC394_04870 [Bacteroides sp.]|nr:hypothetical protein [Bacteroides sp.]
MRKFMLALTTAFVIVCIMSVTAVAASALSAEVESEQFRFYPKLTDDTEHTSLAHEHKYSNIGFVATKLESDITQNLYVTLKHNPFLLYEQVGERIICTSNRVGGGFTWEECSTSGKYKWSAQKYSDTAYDIDCYFVCGSISDGNFKIK